MIKLVRRAARKLLTAIMEPNAPPISPEWFGIVDLGEWQQKIVQDVQLFTMTGTARTAALVEATTFIVRNNIAGDFAECGVWRGGSMMAVAKTLKHLGDTSRSLWLYDTYEGMTAPTDEDISHDGIPAIEGYEAHRDKGGWCRADLSDVMCNMRSTKYPEARMHFIVGKVEDTIPGSLPGRLSMLRLDTDWYQSTAHELQHLCPLLVDDAMLMIDDYGHWRGSRRAVDEYLERHGAKIYLHRVDYSARLLYGAGRALR